MSWFTTLVDQIASIDPVGGKVIDWASGMPGTPEAALKGLAGGMSGEYSWNPYSSDGPAVSDVSAGGKFSSNEDHRNMGRTIGTLIGAWYLGGLAGGGETGTGAVDMGGAGGIQGGTSSAGLSTGTADSGLSLGTSASGGAGSSNALGTSGYWADAGAAAGAGDAASVGLAGSGTTAAQTSLLGSLGDNVIQGLSNMNLTDWTKVLAGGYGLYNSYEQRQVQREEQKRRKQYQDRLDSLMNNPSSVTSMPGYQAGLEAVQRSMAAQGFAGSGNMMAALAKYGGDFFNQQVGQLSSLAGGPPSSASISAAQGAALSNEMSSLGLMASGFSGNQQMTLQSLLKSLGYGQGA